VLVEHAVARRDLLFIARPFFAAAMWYCGCSVKYSRSPRIVISSSGSQAFRARLVAEHRDAALWESLVFGLKWID
jgi:hypothetical protein